jgi:hypothetical protein
MIEGQERWEEIGRDDTIGHLDNFINCVRTRQQPYENATVGHLAAAVPHLINLSAKHQKVVQWDRSREKVKAD